LVEGRIATAFRGIGPSIIRLPVLGFVKSSPMEPGVFVSINPGDLHHPSCAVWAIAGKRLESLTGKHVGI
jgi:hypothetical protein